MVPQEDGLVLVGRQRPRYLGDDVPHGRAAEGVVNHEPRLDAARRRPEPIRQVEGAAEACGRLGAAKRSQQRRGVLVAEW
eukprot:scaffold125633_cov63-Phaeocystis_antarctica.AAC.1